MSYREEYPYYLRDYERSEILPEQKNAVNHILKYLIADDSKKNDEFWITRGLYSVYDKKIMMLDLRNFSLREGKTLPGDLFAGLDDLENVFLGGCPYLNLPDQLLAPLPNLKVFYLTDCRIDQFPESLFRKNLMLETIFIRNVNIEYLPSFKSLEHLEDLSCINTDLQKIAEDFFVGKEGLKIFDISHNRIRSIPHTIFANCKFLRELILEHNPFDDKTLIQRLFAEYRMFGHFSRLQIRAQHTKLKGYLEQFEYVDLEDLMETNLQNI